MVNTVFTPTEEKYTAEELKVSYWYVTHRLLLRRIGFLVLGVFDLLLIMYVLYGLADYYIISRPQVSRMYENLTAPQLDYQYLYELSQPVPLTLAAVKPLAISENQYDLLAEVTNSNTTWQVANLRYHFESGAIITPTRTDFILPGQTKYLMELGLAREAQLGNFNLVIENIQWQKISDYGKLAEKILNFQVLNAQFFSAAQSGATEAVQVSRVVFNVYNNSAYNFYDVNLKVLLYRGQELVGVNSIPVEVFNSGAVQNIDYLIYHRIQPASQVMVYPDVNILNPASFKTFSGAGEAK